MVSSRNKLPGSSLSVHTPGTSVMRMSFAAPSDAASSPAAVSALTLSACPVSSIATVATTGTAPESKRPRKTLTSTLVTSPTNPSSGSRTRPRRVFPSFPQIPTALPPATLMSDTSDLFTLPTDDDYGSGSVEVPREAKRFDFGAAAGVRARVSLSREAPRRARRD